MKKAVVLVPSEIAGGIAEPLLNTFRDKRELELHVLTNKVIYDFGDAEEFLERYGEKIREIVDRYAAEDVEYYLLCGGNAFLLVFLCLKLRRILKSDPIYLLVYRKHLRRYAIFDEGGREVRLEDEGEAE